MELSKIFFIFLVIILATTIFASETTEDDSLDLDHVAITPDEPSLFLRQSGRFLAYKPRAWRTCDKYPRVCDNRGSPGPDCCKKQCVNVMHDKANCGKCGKRCKYSESCCQGKCVNTLKDRKNCGSCKNRCKKGSSCVYGMCSYA